VDNVAAGGRQRGIPPVRRGTRGFHGAKELSWWRFGHCAMALLFIAQQTEGSPRHCLGEIVTVPRKNMVCQWSYLRPNLCQNIDDKWLSPSQV
jgi:hypothetical protein